MHAAITRCISCVRWLPLEDGTEIDDVEMHIWMKTITFVKILLDPLFSPMLNGSWLNWYAKTVLNIFLAKNDLICAWQYVSFVHQVILENWYSYFDETIEEISESDFSKYEINIFLLIASTTWVVFEASGFFNCTDEKHNYAG